jgi:hypothetical protein
MISDEQLRKFDELDVRRLLNLVDEDLKNQKLLDNLLKEEEEEEEEKMRERDVQENEDFILAQSLEEPCCVQSADNHPLYLSTQ